MKNFRRIVCLLLISMITIIILGFSNKKEISIEEEANPIRNNNIIVGLDYILKLNHSNNSKITVKSNILNSINHYKDINQINDFFVLLKLKNNKHKYLVRNVSLVDKSGNLEVYNINYIKSDKNTIRLNIDKNILSYYKAGYDIQIELEK